MYLGGIAEAKQVVHEQKRSIEGVSFLTTRVLAGGRNLTLGTTNLNGAVQGIWFQQDVDQIKALETANASVTLNYHGDVYTVKIVDTSDFKQMFQSEVVQPCKAYLGTVKMIEV
jgi:hypothetical protein